MRIENLECIIGDPFQFIHIHLRSIFYYNFSYAYFFMCFLYPFIQREYIFSRKIYFFCVSQLPYILIGVTGLFLMSYVVYRIVKRKNGLEVKETNILPAVFMPSKVTNGTKNKKSKAPENPFRYIVFRLEKQLKHPYSRRRRETLEDWLFRLKRLEISINEVLIIQSYNEARYSQNKLDSHLLTSLEKKLNILLLNKKAAKEVDSTKIEI